jgi:ERCC4-type nuclease
VIRVLEIVTDVHERRSGIPDRLERLGARVLVRALTRGDFVLGPGYVAERKTAVDLHLTVGQGRFWQQMRKIRDAGPRPFLLVEGSLRIKGGGIPLTSIRGLLLATGDLGVSVVWTEDVDDSAAWLMRIAERARSSTARDRPFYGHRPRRSRTVHPAEQALAAAPGVSTVTARALLRRFGSLHQVVSAPSDELRQVPGVGRARAAALASMIHDRWPATDAL